MKKSVKQLIVLGMTASTVLLTSGCSLFDKENSKYAAQTKHGNISKELLYESMLEKVGEDTLNDLVTLTVLEDKYKVTNQEIDQELKRLKSDYGDNYLNFLAQSGVDTEQQLRKKLKLDLLKNKLAEEHVKVTESELKALYDTKKPKLHVSHILLTDEAQAKAVKAKLDAGEDFNKLAMEYSQDSATKNVGGDMGILQSGSMIPAFEDKAYELQVGQISEPIQTNYGFHIIKILDKQKLPSFKEMKPQLTAELIEQNMDQQKLQNEIEKLVDKSDLKINEETLKDMYKKKEVIEKSSPK